MSESPSWPYDVSPAMLQSLRRVDLGLGAISRAPLLPQLRQRLRKEAVRLASRASAGIEGVLVEDQVLRHLLSGGQPYARNEREVAALVRLYEWVAKERRGRTLSEADCKLLHRMVWHRVLVASMTGRYRKEPVYVWDGPVAIYEAPPAAEVPGLMRAFGTWLESLGQEHVHPVLAAGIAQYEFVRIHPFIDGNGRASRGLSALVLRALDADAGGLLAQEQQMLERLREFYAALDASNTARSLQPWLDFYCATMATEVERVVREVDMVNSLTPGMAGASFLRLNPRQQVYLRLLQVNGILSAAQARQETGSSAATFYRDLAALVRVGVVRAEGSTKGRIYRLVLTDG